MKSINNEKAIIALVVPGAMAVVLPIFEPVMGGAALIAGTGVVCQSFGLKVNRR